ncbi:MAG: hypothetical protein FWE03_01280 [Firmicutes bacterium]|nr:hypothetical protein [Bacillota bacterium]
MAREKKNDKKLESAIKTMRVETVSKEMTVGSELLSEPKKEKRPFYNDNGIKVFVHTDVDYRDTYEIVHEGKSFHTGKYKWSKEYCDGLSAYGTMTATYTEEPEPHLILETIYDRPEKYRPKDWVNDVWRYVFTPSVKGERLLDKSVINNACDKCINEYCYRFNYSDKKRLEEEYDVRTARITKEIADLEASGGEIDLEKCKYQGKYGSAAFDGQKKIKLNESQLRAHKDFLQKAIVDIAMIRKSRLDQVKRDEEQAARDSQEYEREELRKSRRTPHKIEFETALEITTLAHKNQVDKQGHPYIWHAKIVARLVKNDKAKIAALLHDVIEDSNFTLSDLKEKGISDEVIAAVDCLTKRDGEDELDYYKRIHTSDLAIEVKLADMCHNSDIYRFPISEKERAIENHKKYKGRAQVMVLMLGKNFFERIEKLATADTIKWFQATDKDCKHDYEYTSYGLARAIMTRALREKYDKYDKDGGTSTEDRIREIIAIAALCNSENAKIAALLRDVISSSSLYYTYDSQLIKAGLPIEAVEAAKSIESANYGRMMHDTDNDRYYTRIAENKFSAEAEFARLDYKEKQLLLDYADPSKKEELEKIRQKQTAKRKERLENNDKAKEGDRIDRFLRRYSLTLEEKLNDIEDKRTLLKSKLVHSDFLMAVESVEFFDIDGNKMDEKDVREYAQKSYWLEKDASEKKLGAPKGRPNTTVVTGTIERGAVKIGNRVQVLGYTHASEYSNWIKVVGIAIEGVTPKTTVVEEAKAGDFVHLTLDNKGVNVNHDKSHGLRRGNVLGGDSDVNAKNCGVWFEVELTPKDKFINNEKAIFASRAFSEQGIIYMPIGDKKAIIMLNHLCFIEVGEEFDVYKNAGDKIISAKAKVLSIDNVKVCPFCFSDKVIPICYGTPGTDMEKAAMRGDIMLGGCCVDPEYDLHNKCKDCNLLFNYGEKQGYKKFRRRPKGK